MLTDDFKNADYYILAFPRGRLSAGMPELDRIRQLVPPDSTRVVSHEWIREMYNKVKVVDKTPYLIDLFSRGGDE